MEPTTKPTHPPYKGEYTTAGRLIQQVIQQAEKNAKAITESTTERNERRLTEQEQKAGGNG